MRIVDDKRQMRGFRLIYFCLGCWLTLALCLGLFFEVLLFLLTNSWPPAIGPFAVASLGAAAHVGKGAMGLRRSSHAFAVGLSAGALFRIGAQKGLWAAAFGVGVLALISTPAIILLDVTKR